MSCRTSVMDEKKFQAIISGSGLTEFAFRVELKLRVGDEFPGWAQNNVEAVIKKVLPKNGIMVDGVKFLPYDGTGTEAVDWRRGT